jgi:hypothetical protein
MLSGLAILVHGIAANGACNFSVKVAVGAFARFAALREIEKPLAVFF